jgi:hypothetical protein
MGIYLLKENQMDKSEERLRAGAGAAFCEAIFGEGAKNRGPRLLSIMLKNFWNFSQKY